MAKYKLNNAETVQVTIYNVPKTKTLNGRQVVTYSNYIRLTPGEVYESDDEAMLSFFRKYKRKIRYNPSIENALKAANVPYEIEYCKSCGGKVKKISYRQVEVLDE